MTTKSCGCAPQPFAAYEVETLKKMAGDMNLLADARIAKNVGFPNYSWREDGPSGQRQDTGVYISDQQRSAGNGNHVGPTQAALAASGGDASEQSRRMDSVNQNQPLTTRDVIELGESIKSLNKLLGALLKAAEEEEEEEGEPTDAGGEEGREDEDEMNQRRWANGKASLDDAVSGRAVLNGTPATLMTAIRGGGLDTLEKTMLFKSNPQAYVLAKSKAIEAAFAAGRVADCLEDEIAITSILATAAAVAEGHCGYDILKSRLAGCSADVRNLFDGID